MSREELLKLKKEEVVDKLLETEGYVDTTNLLNYYNGQLIVYDKFFELLKDFLRKAVKEEKIELPF